MDMLTDKQWNEINNKQYYADTETINYRRWITDCFEPEIKNKYIRIIIEDLIKDDNPGFANKYYCELIYNNMVLEKFLDEYSNQLPKLEVKKSKIHGNGLFSKCEIERDHIVTFYPIHYIRGDGNRTYLSSVIMENGCKMESFNMNKYILTGREKELVQIGGHPEIYENYRNGHIANHSKRPNAYFALVRNGDIMTNIWMLIAIKFIDIGDEILVDYGPRAQAMIDLPMIR